MEPSVSVISPLTLEERVQIGNLFGHDFVSQLAILGNMALVTGHTISAADNDKAGALMEHLGYVIETFRYLSVENGYLFVRGQSDFESFKKLFPYSMEQKKGQITLKLENIPKFRTDTGIVYTALFNLVKNSFKSDWNAQVQVEISPYSGKVPEQIEDAVFVPEKAKIEGEFVRMAVHDNGPGFPKDRSPLDFLELGVSTKKDGGFGLFFVKIAAKYLQAPLAIHSEPGNTSVALYHPMDLGK